MKKECKSASQFIVELAAAGRYHFTTVDASAVLGSSLPAVRAALRRLKSRGDIAMPYRGFYVIIPPEYRKLECLPASQFIPQLMDYLGEDYYVGLLSAAQFHGAAHQQPQVFQVFVKTNRPQIKCGAVRVMFAAKHNVMHIPKEKINTPRGYLLISTKEATAFDLIGYMHYCGGTALYKLYTDTPVRYSEDIDLVQISSGPIGPILDNIRPLLDPWLGTPQRVFKEGRVNLVYRFKSEDMPPIVLRLKIEINTREHFSVLGFITKRFVTVHRFKYRILFILRSLIFYVLHPSSFNLIMIQRWSWQSLEICTNRFSNELVCRAALDFAGTDYRP